MNKRKRTEINVAYEFLSNDFFGTVYSNEETELIHAIITGDTDMLMTMLESDMKWLSFRTKGANYPILYIAVRSGHYDIV